MVPLSERVQQALDAGWTMSDLARAAGKTSGAASQWRTTVQRLSGESVAGLARLTGWSTQWWANGVGPREASPRPPVDVAQAIAALSEHAAADMSDDLREDLADALRKLVMRRGDDRSKSEALRLIDPPGSGEFPTASGRRRQTRDTGT